ncbi:MAG: hypothetical protein ACKVON_02820 [Beijerinckiaceae bacterium]
MKHLPHTKNAMAEILRRADGSVDTTAYEAIARRERARFVSLGWSALRQAFNGKKQQSHRASSDCATLCPTTR